MVSWLTASRERSPELPKSLIGWVVTFWKIPDVYALRHQGLDAYLFLRYLRVCVEICFVSICITWPILFPIHATGGNGKQQLELISYSNIDIEKNASRLYAHAVLAWVIYGFIMYTITRECVFYINLRQAFLLSPRVSKRLSSRTVLITCVPDEYLTERRIRSTFGDCVKSVWIHGNSLRINKLVKRRDKILMRLEMAETDFIRAANKRRIRMAKKAVKRNENDGNSNQDLESTYPVDPTLRPRHRPTLFGNKVDTIDWCRQQLERLIPEIVEEQRAWESGKFKKAPAVFVEFHTQYDAQIAYEGVTHHHALSMSPKAIGVRPGEVIWSNLTIPWWQIIIRQYLMYALVAVLIIFWAIPVGVVGIIAQVSVLQSLPFLTWIQMIPPVCSANYANDMIG